MNYTRIGSAFNKPSENIFFYILTLTIIAVVFDFLRAIAEYWFQKKNMAPWSTFWFRKWKSERVKTIISVSPNWRKVLKQIRQTEVRCANGEIGDRQR